MDKKFKIKEINGNKITLGENIECKINETETKMDIGKR